MLNDEKKINKSDKCNMPNKFSSNAASDTNIEDSEMCAKLLT